MNDVHSTNHVVALSLLSLQGRKEGFYFSKIHLWRHSIVLALHYFQGMACYRSATLLEVMVSRSFWNMFVFSWVICRWSCTIYEVHSNNSCFSMNKKMSMVTARLEPTPSKMWLKFWVLRSTSWAITALKERDLFQIYKICNYKKEGYIWYIIMYWYVNAKLYNIWHTIFWGSSCSRWVDFT